MGLTARSGRTWCSETLNRRTAVPSQSGTSRPAARDYGLDGSIRTDVVLRDPESPNSRPIAIWDVKTGGARLSGSRVTEIRDQVGVGTDVPVIELHITHGVTKKGRTSAGVICAFIAA